MQLWISHVFLLRRANAKEIFEREFQTLENWSLVLLKDDIDAHLRRKDRFSQVASSDQVTDVE